MNSAKDIFGLYNKSPSSLKRTCKNPIMQAKPDNYWESHYVFNAAALYLDDKVHLLYRAIGHSGLSVLGYAASRDGIHFDERSAEPAYICSGPVVCKIANPCLSSYAFSSGGNFSGCEDPRLTKIDDTIYMTYTAFSAWVSPPSVALTSISVNNFLERHWCWKKPVLISTPHEMHKNWVIFPEKINNKFVLLHSISPNILIDYFDTLNFCGDNHVPSHYSAAGRKEYWDNMVRGVGPPPIKTKEGWLVLYHAMDKNDPNKYKIGALILDEQDPRKILYRCSTPLLEPDAPYENEGFKAGVIYACGAVVVDEKLYIYYGGADTVICAAIANLETLLMQIKKA
jgi:predicted GH43/DUF377 family glycosyl hydrolase